MYYGNPSAVSESNGEAVFDFFDDFNNTDLDLNKWAAFASGGNYSVANSYVTLSPVPNENNAVALRSNVQFVNDIIVEAKVNPSDTYYDLGLITTGNIITSWVHISGRDNLGYSFVAQAVTKTVTSSGYYLRRRDPGDGVDLAGPVGKGQQLQEIIYRFIYTSGGLLRGEVELLDGTIWTTLQVTDITYLSDNKYIVIWQGEYYKGLGGPSSWDWVRVRKYASVEPSVSIGVEETSGGASYFEAITDQVVIFEQYVRSSYYTQTVSDDLFISDVYAFTFAVNLITDILLSEATDKTAGIKERLIELLNLNEILPFQYWRGEAIPVKLLSQIIAVKLLNSDIETIKEIYSLISNVKRLGGD
jgi:hypothetical protein